MEQYLNTSRKSLEERQQSLSLCQFAVTDTKNHSLVYSTVATKEPAGPVGEDGQELTLGFRPRESSSESVDGQLTFHVLFDSDSLEEVLVYHFYGFDYERFTDLIINYFEKHDFPTDDNKMMELLKDLSDSQKEKNYDSVHRRFYTIVRYEQVEPLTRQNNDTRKFSSGKERKIHSIEIQFKDYYTEIDPLKWGEYNNLFWQWYKQAEDFEEDYEYIDRERDLFYNIVGLPEEFLDKVYDGANLDALAEIIRSSAVVRTDDNAKEKYSVLKMRAYIHVDLPEDHSSIRLAMRTMYEYLETVDTKETPLEQVVKRIEEIVSAFLPDTNVYLEFGKGFH